MPKFQFIKYGIYFHTCNMFLNIKNEHQSMMPVNFYIA